MKKLFTNLKVFMTLCLLLVGIGNTWGADFVKVSSTNDLVAGSEYIIVSGSTYAATTSMNGTKGVSLGSVTKTNDVVTSANNTAIFTLEGEAGAWKLKTGNNYLSANGDDNKSQFVTTTDGESTFTISFVSQSGSLNIVTTTTSKKRCLRANSTTDIRFYSGETSTSGIVVYLYKKKADVSVTGVSLNTNTLSLNVGATGNLTATIAPDNATNKNVTWSSNQESVATVSESGVVTAVAAGTATITVTTQDGNKTASCEVTVTLNKLATPENLQATPAPTSATLTWDAVANASKYEVNINNKTLTAETNSLLVGELAASTAYTWTVKAIGDNTTYADSDESEESSFTTLDPPTVAYTVTFDGNGHGTPASESITEASAGAGVTLPNCTPNAGYQFVGWATSETATEAEYAAGATYYPTENITLHAVYDKVFTINYMVNGVNTDAQENVKEGTPLVFPTVTAPDADHVFRGWVTEAIEGTTDTEPAYVNTTDLTATADATYYAVFAEEEAGKKTLTKLTNASDLSAGDNIAIVAEISQDNSKLMYQETVSSSYVAYKTIGTDVQLTADGISADSKNYWTLTAGSDGKWKLGDATNGYLNGSSSSNNLSVTTNSTAEFDISYSSNHFAIKCGSKSVGSRSDLTGDNQYKFRMGGTTTLDFYKLSNGAPTYTNYCTTIVTKTLTSISLSGEYPTEFWKGGTFSHEGMIVTAHYDDESTKDVTSSATFTGYDMSAAGNQTVTVTYDTKSTTYGITVNTIANTLETAYTVAEAKAIIDANPAELATTEVYVKGKVSKIVTAFNSGFGNISFDVSADGETTGNQFQFYRNFKGADKTKWASETDVPGVGEDVIGLGKLTKYTKDNNTTYEFAEGNYIVSRSRDIKISDVGYATAYVPFDATVTGATAYYVTVEGSSAKLHGINGTIPANTGVVLKGEEGTATLTESAVDPVSVDGNLLVGTTDAEGKDFDTSGFTYYILSNGTNGVGFYWDGDEYNELEGLGAHCPQYKAILAVPESAGIKSFYLFDDEATGIQEAFPKSSPERTDLMFNLAGQVVGKDYKGIVIVNGKKMWNK